MAIKTDTLKKLNVDAVNRRAILVHRVSMTQKVIAYLAFTWSTVVLLGGYVTSLEKKDFLCLTLLSLAEATRIFDDTVLDEKLGQSIFRVMWTSAQMAVDITKDGLPTPGNSFRRKLAAVLFTGILLAPVVAVIFSILFLMEVSSILFVALPAWRILKHDYGVIVGDSSKATLVPALDIFYSLVLVQGVLSFFLHIIRLTQRKLMDRFYGLCGFPEGWGRYAFAQYFEYTMAKSKQDLASVEKASSLFSHACELLGSESDEKYITGICVLGTLAKQGTGDPQFSILLSRENVQKLILTLGWNPISALKQMLELREHSARIVAGFAGAIHLVQFPGAARCISTLLEPTQDGGRNELIVQGLYILEQLALDHDNCREICSTPGLLPKIMAPICSSELVRDTRIARSPVVSGTFKVLRMLIIRAPGKAGRRLRRDISCNKQAVTNLETIIVDQGNEYGVELPMRAMEILLELAEDESINLRPVTMQNVIKKQLHIFLAMEGEAAAVDKANNLNATAGRALSVLSSKSESNSTIIIKEHESIGRLTEIFDPKNNIQYRIYAAEIFTNLCKHCALVDMELVPKEILLRKVLPEIRGLSKEEQQTISSTGRDDEEKQNPKEKSDSEDADDISGYEKRSAVKELQEALLSLTLHLYDLVGADRFALVAKEVAPGEGAFVASLKTIIERNCEASLNSLRIVKLCYKIAISMVQRNHYTAHFKDPQFLESVSMASGIMSETESCLLITGTSGIYKKTTLRPLLYELESKLKQELDGAG